MKLNDIFKIINLKNIDQGISTFNKLVQDFGDSMDKMTGELSSDIEKSNRELEFRKKKNQENLDKIWGKKNWDVKYVKSHTKILLDISHGKPKFVDFVAVYVTIFHGMVTIYTNTGGFKIELSKMW